LSCSARRSNPGIPSAVFLMKSSLATLFDFSSFSFDGMSPSAIFLFSSPQAFGPDMNCWACAGLSIFGGFCDNGETPKSPDPWFDPVGTPFVSCCTRDGGGIPKLPPNAELSC
jgi:hypothetical protein